MLLLLIKVNLSPCTDFNYLTIEPAFEQYSVMKEIITWNSENIFCALESIKNSTDYSNYWVRLSHYYLKVCTYVCEHRCISLLSCRSSKPFPGNCTTMNICRRRDAVRVVMGTRVYLTSCVILFSKILYIFKIWTHPYYIVKIKRHPYYIVKIWRYFCGEKRFYSKEENKMF